MRKYLRNTLLGLACLVFVAAITLMPGAKLASAASTPATSCTTAQWPMFGYNVAGTRYNSSEKTLNTANVRTLVENWSFASNIVDGSVTIANGVAYVGSTYNGNLYALNSSTGALIWSYYTNADGIIDTPTVANGVVYVGAGLYLYAVNANTGALIWSSQLGTGIQVSGSPTVANGIVYIMAENEVEYALKAANGKLLWSYTMGTAYGSFSSQVVTNGVVYAGPSDGDTLYALNARTGALLWSYTTTSSSYIGYAPAVVNGVVYFSSGYNVYALNASTGAFLWSYATGNYVQDAPAVAGGVVYFASNDDNLYALNASTGALLWSYNAGSLITLSPLVANGVVYDATPNGTLFALATRTGKLLWSYTGLGESTGGSPTIANGMLYISGGFSGYVYGFSLPTVMPVSPSTLAFSGQAGGIDPAGQNVNLNNTGASTITWTGCSTQSWLTLSSTSGSINPGTSTPLTININNTGLGVGTYFGDAILVPSSGPTVIVNVTLTLT